MKLACLLKVLHFFYWKVCEFKFCWSQFPILSIIRSDKIIRIRIWIRNTVCIPASFNPNKYACTVGTILTRTKKQVKSLFYSVHCRSFFSSFSVNIWNTAHRKIMKTLHKQARKCLWALWNSISNKTTETETKPEQNKKETGCKRFYIFKKTQKHIHKNRALTERKRKKNRNTQKTETIQNRNKTKQNINITEHNGTQNICRNTNTYQDRKKPKQKMNTTEQSLTEQKNNTTRHITENSKAEQNITKYNKILEIEQIITELNKNRNRVWTKQSRTATKTELEQIKYLH